MKSTYEEIEEDLIEGTSEYDKFRRNHIGGSDIGAILGVNPYKSPYMLWLEKIGVVAPDKENEAMKRGRALEADARDLYIEKTKTSLVVKRFKYKPWPVLVASVDGISLDEKIIYEAKCPTTSTLMNEAAEGRIPEYYKAQMQQYLMIINKAEYCDYHVHVNEQNNLIINVEPDERLHEEILKKAKEFWKMVQNKIPPERRKGDPYYEDNEMVNNKVLLYKNLKLKYKEMEKEVKEMEKEIKEFVNEPKVIFGDTGVSATVCEGRSIVEWKKLAEDLNLNNELIENYRKKSSAYIIYKM